MKRQPFGPGVAQADFIKGDRSFPVPCQMKSGCEAAKKFKEGGVLGDGLMVPFRMC